MEQFEEYNLATPLEHMLDCPGCGLMSLPGPEHCELNLPTCDNTEDETALGDFLLYTFHDELEQDLEQDLSYLENSCI